MSTRFHREESNFVSVGIDTVTAGAAGVAAILHGPSSSLAERLRKPDEHQIVWHVQNEMEGHERQWSTPEGGPPRDDRSSRVPRR